MVHAKQVKKGPFAEVSPMLNDISGLESWRKVSKLTGRMCVCYLMHLSVQAVGPASCLPLYRLCCPLVLPCCTEAFCL